MLSSIRDLRRDGVALAQANVQARCYVLMIGLAASLVFLPVVNNGTGAEVPHPLATVVIGGIIPTALPNLLVLSALDRLAYAPESALHATAVDSKFAAKLQLQGDR